MLGVPSRESLENTVHMNQKKLVLECTWCVLNVTIRTTDDVIIQIDIAAIVKVILIYKHSPCLFYAKLVQ